MNTCSTVAISAEARQTRFAPSRKVNFDTFRKVKFADDVPRGTFIYDSNAFAPAHYPVLSDLPTENRNYSKPRQGGGTGTSRKRLQFRKIQLCPWFSKGTCFMGKHCNYAHSIKELRPKPDLRNTRMCPEVCDGRSCNNAYCRFAHSTAELQATNAFLKTKLCPTWQQGNYCSLGRECRFAHGTVQLRQQASDSFESDVHLMLTKEITKESQIRTAQRMDWRSHLPERPPSSQPLPLLSISRTREGSGDDKGDDSSTRVRCSCVDSDLTSADTSYRGSEMDTTERNGMKGPNSKASMLRSISDAPCTALGIPEYCSLCFGTAAPLTQRTTNNSLLSPPEIKRRSRSADTRCMDLGGVDQPEFEFKNHFVQLQQNTQGCLADSGANAGSSRVSDNQFSCTQLELSSSSLTACREPARIQAPAGARSGVLEHTLPKAVRSHDREIKSAVPASPFSSVQSDSDDEIFLF